MSDGGDVKDNGFTEKLDKLAEGLSYDELFEVNKKAAQVFADTVKPMIPERDNVNEKYHIRESVVIERKKNNGARVGVLTKSKKAYVAYFLNNGWDSSWAGKRGKKLTRSGHKIQGLNFWEKAAKEANAKMNENMAAEVKKIIERKTGGA